MDSWRGVGGHKAADFGGHHAYKYGGHPAPAGRALPNLLMRSKCKSQSQKRVIVDFDFNILTA